MGESLPLFASSFNASLFVEARPERLTGDAGAILVREVIERSGIIGWMIERLHDHRQPHLVTYPLADLLRTMLILFAQGWRDQDDADALRFDPALRLAVSGTRGTAPLAEGAHPASQPTLSRLLDARLRPGNAHTAEGALDFVLDLVDRLEGTMCQVAMVRMDAGFPEEKLLAGLEARGTPYVARLRNNRVLDRMAAPHLRRPPGRPPAEPRMWFHEVDCRAGARSRSRRVVLVVQERPGDLLLGHSWLLTGIGGAASPAEELLAHYRQRGPAEGHFGELMDVLAPALSSTPRARRHYRGRPLPAPPTGIDAAARNEAPLLLHLLACEIMHAGRRVMEIATGTGWSLRRFRERVLRVGGRVLLHARRVTLVAAETAARHWAALWPRFERCARPGT